ncbi:MAG: gliding motility-associated protein GldE [Lewinella sp.]|nr:gliding motility-associated protein GldE [Lewinella sp.]
MLTLPSSEVILGILAILFLLLCSALVSGSEVAFFSLTPNDFEKLNQENTGSSRRILYLKDKPRKLLATILISNNFINIGIVILSEYVLSSMLSAELFNSWAESLSPALNWLNLSQEDLAKGFKFLLTVVLVTFLLVLFGEVAPKVYARINNLRLARAMAAPLDILMRLLSPISAILVNWTKVLEGRLLLTAAGAGLASREDIDEAIELTVSNEEDSGQEVDLLKSIVKFGEVSVKQIMRSRIDVIAVDHRISYHELLEVVRESGYSRIPVYDEDFDKVIGLLYVKDLLGHLNQKEDFHWQQLIRTNVLFVPEAKKIDDLLREFQKEHLHMAIVVDEYGGSAGIVTLEDIMEEIIGEIQDEFDEDPEVIYHQVDERNFVFDGKTLLNDVCRIVGVDTSTFDEVKGESDSVAGLLLELTGGMPKEGEEIVQSHYTFRVLKVSERRIESIQFTLPEEESTADK